MRKLLPIAVVWIAAACSDPIQPTPALCTAPVVPAEAVVTIAWHSSQDDMHVLVRNQSAVRAACDFIAGASTAGIAIGRIAVGAGPADPRVPFHYIPESVQFADAAIELCDSALLRTPEAVEAFFHGTGSDLSETAPFCPWGARPVDVRPAPGG